MCPSRSYLFKSCTPKSFLKSNNWKVLNSKYVVFQFYKNKKGLNDDYKNIILSKPFYQNILFFFHKNYKTSVALTWTRSI